MNVCTTRQLEEVIDFLNSGLVHTNVFRELFNGDLCPWFDADVPGRQLLEVVERDVLLFEELEEGLGQVVDDVR